MKRVKRPFKVSMGRETQQEENKQTRIFCEPFISMLLLMNGHTWNKIEFQLNIIKWLLTSINHSSNHGVHMNH